MSTRAGVGHSLATEPAVAGRDAAMAAMASLGGRSADACLVFATAAYDQSELIGAIRRVVGAARVSGCSGEGIIVGPDSHERDHAVAVMVIASDVLRFEPFLGKGLGEDSAGLARDLGCAIQTRGAKDAIGLWVMPDGIRGDHTEFLGALRESLDIPVLGGTAADGMRFERTYQYCDDEIASDSVAAVLIRGQGSLEFAVSHGCRPIGLERTITATDGSWIREIDGEPAWSVFKEYLAGDPEDLNADGIVHLCVGKPLPEDDAAGYAPYIIRTPMHLNHQDGSLYFPGGGMEEGQAIRLTRRDPERIKASARECAERILDRQSDRKPALVVQFDCAGRGRVLFGDCAAREIVHPLQESLGTDTPWIGFHTYGEIAPVNGMPYYHNYTVVLCALYDDA